MLFKLISSGLLFAVIAMPAHADSIFKIEVGASADVSKAELEKRVYFLERAVLQLQQRVFALEDVKKEQPAKSTCFIKTPFNGTFSASEATETAAKAAAMEACSKAGASSIYCDEDRVKCGK